MSMYADLLDLIFGKLPSGDSENVLNVGSSCHSVGALSQWPVTVTAVISDRLDAACKERLGVRFRPRLKWVRGVFAPASFPIDADI